MIEFISPNNRGSYRELPWANEFCNSKPDYVGHTSVICSVKRLQDKLFCQTEDYKFCIFDRSMADQLIEALEFYVQDRDNGLLLVSKLPKNKKPLIGIDQEVKAVWTKEDNTFVCRSDKGSQSQDSKNPFIPPYTDMNKRNPKKGTSK